MKKIFFLTVAALFCATSLCLADDCNTPTISAATITFTYEEMPPVGVTSIKAKFSVSATQQVYFSQGNLQYQGSTNSLRFAPNQWDYFYARDEGNQKTISNGRANQSAWIDLFPWGSGNNPASVSSPGSFNEWGYKYTEGVKSTNNIISNAAPEDQWRTLSKEEWQYLNLRKDANGDYLVGCATLKFSADTTGIILLPDDWIMPAGCTFTFVPINKYKEEGFYKDNYPSKEDWIKMEEAGAIFLPVTGAVDFNSTSNGRYGMSNGTCGQYWTSTKPSTEATYISFNGQKAGTSNSGIYLENTFNISRWACAVRLVLDVPTTPAQ